MPDNEARTAFPKILSSYMEQRAMSQSDIARSLNVSKQIVSDWLNGKKFPRVDKMQELAELFGVLMSDMYSYERHQNDLVFAEHYSQEEYRLIMAYRAADDRAREDALKTLLDHPRKKDELSAI